MINPKDVKEFLSNHILADGYDIIVDLQKSHGSWLVDKRNGDEYLDFFTMFASMSVGFNHPKLLEAGDELLSAAINKPSCSDFYTTEMAEFVDTFSRIAIPDYLPHAFFIEGGGCAVENALKTAFDWKTRKNILKGSTVVADKVIYFKQAFHGRTGYALSVTDSADSNKMKFFPKFDWIKVINPCTVHPQDVKLTFKRRQLETDAMKQILSALKKYGHDRIAAIIIEPIQGEGGDNHFDSGFLLELRNLCNSFDMFYIMDEIQTGFGLTGKMWAHQWFMSKPDILCFGKKSQVCGILAGHRIDEVKGNVFEASSRINSTFGGNLVDMVRFKHILRIIDEEDLINNARLLGIHFIQGLRKIVDDFDSQIISNVRGRGLMVAFDLPNTKIRNKVISDLMEDKILVLACGTRGIRFRPNLNVTAEEIDILLTTLKKVFKRL